MSRVRAGVPLQAKEAVTLTCGEILFFRHATPAVNDWLWCFRCADMEQVVKSPRTYGAFYHAQDREMGNE